MLKKDNHINTIYTKWMNEYKFSIKEEVEKLNDFSIFYELKEKLGDKIRVKNSGISQRVLV